MKRIAFLNPPLSLFERYSYLQKSGSNFPNLGLIQLAAVALKHGCQVQIVDAPSLGINSEKCVERILEFKPDIVGITAVTSAIYKAADLARTLKNILPDIVVLIGGAHVTAIPEDTMSVFQDFDIGIIGEGEGTLTDLIQTDANDYSGIEGIIYRKNEKLILTKPRKSDWDLDTLPFPAWNLISGFPEKYKPVAYKFKKLPAAYLVTSRGCPYMCSFCDTSVFGKKIRTFSIPYVIEVIRELYLKYDVREIVFEDDVFLINKKRFIQFCEALIRENINISWSCNARADHVDDEIVTIAKKAGCWLISFGIESGNQHVLELNAKSISLDSVEDAIRICNKHGIYTKGFFILGLPGDTDSSIRDTIEFAKSCGLDDVSVSKMTPFPGTRIYNNGNNHGTFDKDWKSMNLVNSVYVPNGLSCNRLDYYHVKFLREFYLRKQTIQRYMMRILKNPGLTPVYMKSALGLLKVKSADISH